MLIFYLLLFQFPKINKLKTKTSPPVTATGPAPPTRADATTMANYQHLVIFKSMTRYMYREFVLSFHQLVSIHWIHQPMIYFGRLIKFIRKQKTNIKWLVIFFWYLTKIVLDIYFDIIVLGI